MSKPKEFHRANEFNKFPWDKLIYGQYQTNGENYNFGKGGSNYVNGSGWQITVFSDKNDLSSQTWELPKALSDMLDYQEKYGKEKNQEATKKAFKEILGL